MIKYFKMNIKIILLISVILSATSCTKDKSHQITGTWEWVSTTGGIAGINETPQSTGMEKMLIINDEFIFYYENGDLVRQSAYKIVEAPSIYSSGTVKQVEIEGSSIRQSFLAGDLTLVMRDEVYDGFEHTYIRLE
jgi:hypothetical protein